MSADKALARLEQLRSNSAEVERKGFFSSEFQRWHEGILNVFRQQFQQNDSILIEFQELEFEWPLQKLESLYNSLAASLSDVELAGGLARSKDQVLLRLQEQQFRKAMGRANELLAMAVTDLKSREC